MHNKCLSIIGLLIFSYILYQRKHLKEPDVMIIVKWLAIEFNGEFTRYIYHIRVLLLRKYFHSCVINRAPDRVALKAQSVLKQGIHSTKMIEQHRFEA